VAPEQNNDGDPDCHDSYNYRRYLTPDMRFFLHENSRSREEPRATTVLPLRLLGYTFGNEPQFVLWNDEFSEAAGQAHEHLWKH